jgi:uncharacterized protein YjbI with pentapeptide repeats
VKNLGKLRPLDDRLQWRPISAWTWTLIAAAAVAVTAFAITVWLLAIASHAAAGTDLASARLDAVRTGLAAGGGAGAAVGLMLAFRRQHHQEIATLLADQDATQRRITELYTKAVEQLGSDKAPVRLGGLYALERLAQDNPSQRQTIVNVICAYLRMPFPPMADDAVAAAPNRNAAGENPETNSAVGTADDVWQQEKQVRITAQRIISDHLRQQYTREDSNKTDSPRFWKDTRLDLAGATLIDFDLSTSTLDEALFDGATFKGSTNFNNATFTGYAQFNKASFSEMARFAGTTFLSYATFVKATFSKEALFGGATFNSAQFIQTAFDGSAQFSRTTFKDYSLFSEAAFSSGVQFESVTFNGGIQFDGATFCGFVKFKKITFDTGPHFLNANFDRASLSFQDAVVKSPDPRTILPTGWQIDESREGVAVITEVDGSEGQDPI